MKKALVVWSIVLMLATCALAQGGRDDAALNALVETERAFSRTAVAKGIREAFLSYLADDGLVFRPGPVNGKESWRGRKEVAGMLTWEPVFADVSRAGDLGYTTGPWEFREKTLADKPVAYGYYITLWRRQPDGTYKFALDYGTDNPTPTGPQPSLQSPPPQRGKTKVAANVNMETESSRLQLRDSAYASEAKSRGMVKAFNSYAADGVRLHRQNNFPVVGKDAARAALAANPGALDWQLAAARVADSGDLGYTYGTYDFKPDAPGKPLERGHYVKIWKRQPGGKWKTVLELMRPLPPPPTKT